MGLSKRTQAAARLAPLVVLVLISALFFTTALSFAKPGKSEDAPGQAKKQSGSSDTESTSDEDAAAAEPTAEKPGRGGSKAGGSGGSTSGRGANKKSGKGGGGKAPAPPDDKDPPGNNGSVKVDALPFDDHRNNEPHVTCTFQIDFYGFDRGSDFYADYSFELKSPTQSPSGNNALHSGSVFIGEDAAGGGKDLDASVTIDLSDALNGSGASPHPKQGYHVKLTVHADGSQGSDTKHKVFWVQPCVAPPSSAPPSSAPPSGSSQSPSPGGSIITSQPPSAPASASASVGGSRLYSQDVPPPEAPSASVLPRRFTQPSRLPFTGGDPALLVTLAGLLLAGGGGLMLASKKKS